MNASRYNGVAWNVVKARLGGSWRCNGERGIWLEVMIGFGAMRLGR